MFPAFGFVAASAYLSVGLIERTSAADPRGNGVSSLSNPEYPVENVTQEKFLMATTETAALSKIPVVWAALSGAVCAALFLVLKYIQPSTSSQKEAGEAIRSHRTRKDAEGDESLEGDEGLAGAGDGESGEEDAASSHDETKVGGGASGFVMEQEESEEEGIMTPYHQSGAINTDDDKSEADTEDDEDASIHRVDDLIGPDPIPERGQPWPPADPAVTLGRKEVEERVEDMQNIVDCIEGSERAKPFRGSRGHSFTYLLWQAFYCSQKNLNAECGPDVPRELNKNFRELVQKMEDLIFAYRFEQGAGNDLRRLVTIGNALRTIEVVDGRESSRGLCGEHWVAGWSS
ncbi:hypothetical protein, conserved [Eimeria maxima]|uniref:Transmembrane protein n=1 Tax=Eimeria maxima TaxID=5804 RepID=U6LXV7_EIMMA|nr:hypothetical protein, conserved [Eimeria maxima]CDJ56802.1 hypothetical protein, conserved [Eimeria maxima]